MSGSNWVGSRNLSCETGFKHDLVLSEVMAELAQLGQELKYGLRSGLICRRCCAIGPDVGIFDFFDGDLSRFTMMNTPVV